MPGSLEELRFYIVRRGTAHFIASQGINLPLYSLLRNWDRPNPKLTLALIPGRGAEANVTNMSLFLKLSGKCI